jgi:hypothetical protein
MFPAHKRVGKKTSKSLCVLFSISSELIRNTNAPQHDPIYFIPVAKGLDHNIRESFLMKKGSHLGYGLPTLYHIKFDFYKAMNLMARQE